MVISDLKYSLIKKFKGEDYRIKIVIQYNRKYRKQNGNLVITKSMIDHVLNGRPCRKRGLILRAINDIL